MTPFDEYFYPIFGSGLAIATLTSIAAGMSRNVILQVALLIVGVLAFWGGLFFGSEIGYQVWQRSPDPPPEAFSDTFPMGALLAGWVPGSWYCGAVFILAIFATRFLFSKTPETVKDDSALPDLESSNPYESPRQASIK